MTGILSVKEPGQKKLAFRVDRLFVCQRGIFVYYVKLKVFDRHFVCQMIYFLVILVMRLSISFINIQINVFFDF